MKVRWSKDIKAYLATEREQNGCRDGVVVRVLASHQCGPGSMPRHGVICGLSLLVRSSEPRGFLRVLLKNQHLT